MSWVSRTLISEWQILYFERSKVRNRQFVGFRTTDPAQAITTDGRPEPRHVPQAHRGTQRRRV